MALNGAESGVHRAPPAPFAPAVCACESRPRNARCVADGVSERRAAHHDRCAYRLLLAASYVPLTWLAALEPVRC